MRNRSRKIWGTALFLSGFLNAGIAGAQIAASNQSQDTTAQPLPKQLVNDLHAAFGEHHARAVHAKGIILEGRFQPSNEAAMISKAKLFRTKGIVIVRFSDFTGIPDIPDNHPLASPRGFAVKFKSGDSEMLDIVAHGFNGFPVATSEEFGQLLLAIAASPPGTKEPNKLSEFLGTHPIAATFLTTQKPMPVSYATNAYFGVNAFAFVNAKGQKSFVRYRFVPQAGEHYFDAVAAAKTSPNFLQEEIATRLKTAPIIFDWYVQISGSGDKIDDPSVAWPEDRKRIKLGTITIDRLTADQQEADRSLLFLPGKVPSGIEIADPMLKIRTAAYPISFRERQ